MFCDESFFGRRTFDLPVERLCVVRLGSLDRKRKVGQTDLVFGVQGGIV